MTRKTGGARAIPATATGAHALGAAALGAFALGALAIGAIAIGRLAVGKARIRRLEIDELIVRRLRVTEQSTLPRSPDSVPSGPMELNQVTMPALSVDASVEFYRKLGFELIVDAPHYARFRSKVGNATFSLHAVDALVEAPKTIVYFECAALDQQVAELKGKGFQFAQEPRDEPWLWREARLVDPSGNIICLYHAGENRLNPPWRVGV